nr:hypothetical protein [Actinacidiphila soli]
MSWLSGAAGASRLGHEGPYVQLRPPRGGREWDVRPERIRLADANDRLRVGVAEVNAHRGAFR